METPQRQSTTFAVVKLTFCYSHRLREFARDFSISSKFMFSRWIKLDPTEKLEAINSIEEIPRYKELSTRYAVLAHKLVEGMNMGTVASSTAIVSRLYWIANQLSSRRTRAGNAGKVRPSPPSQHRR